MIPAWAVSTAQGDPVCARPVSAAQPGAKEEKDPVESWLFLYGKWDHCLQPGGGRQ